MGLLDRFYDRLAQHITKEVARRKKPTLTYELYFRTGAEQAWVLWDKRTVPWGSEKTISFRPVREAGYVEVGLTFVSEELGIIKTRTFTDFDQPIYVAAHTDMLMHGPHTITIQ